MKLTIEITGKKLGDIIVDTNALLRQLQAEMIIQEGRAEYGRTRISSPITIEQHGGPGMTHCKISLTN